MRIHKRIDKGSRAIMPQKCVLFGRRYDWCIFGLHACVSSLPMPINLWFLITKNQRMQHTHITKMIELSAYLKRTLSKRLDSVKESYIASFICVAPSSVKNKRAQERKDRSDGTPSSKKKSFVHSTYKCISLCVFPHFVIAMCRVFLLLLFHFIWRCWEKERKTVKEK